MPALDVTERLHLIEIGRISKQDGQFVFPPNNNCTRLSTLLKKEVRLEQFFHDKIFETTLAWG